MNGMTLTTRTLQEATLDFDQAKEEQAGRPNHTPIGYQIGKGKVRIHFMVREDGGMDRADTSVLQKAELLGVDPSSVRHASTKMHDLSKARVVSVDFDTDGIFKLEQDHPTIASGFEQLGIEPPSSLLQYGKLKDGWKAKSHRMLYQILRRVLIDVDLLQDHARHLTVGRADTSEGSKCKSRRDGC